jgi:chemotaxis signal transduction protein
MTQSPQTGATNPEGIQHLLVSLAGKVFAVRFDYLREVLRYNPDVVAPVPNTVEWLDGIMSLRGTIISVVHLLAFFGYPRFGADLDNLGFDQGLGLGKSIPRLLVAFKDELTVGLVVEEIKGVLFITPGTVKGVTEDAGKEYGPVAPYLEGIYQDTETGQAVALLDLPRLITSPMLANLESLPVS